MDRRPPQPIITEFSHKLERLRKLLADEDLDALLLCRRDNFAWLTCGGDNHVLGASEIGACAILVTPHEVCAIASSLDLPRIVAEEIPGLPGIEIMDYPWHEGSIYESIARRLHPGARIGADTSLPGACHVDREIALLQRELTPGECDRIRMLGAEAGQILMEVCERIKAGKPELSIAARCWGHFQSAGMELVSVLVAADDRMDLFGQPIPTSRTVKDRVMLAVSARRHGLVVSLTRIVSFTPLSDQIQERQAAATRINAAIMASAHPGKTLGEVFAAGIQAYTAEGFPDAWKQYPPDGPAGYRWLEGTGIYKSSQIICQPQAFAWSAALPGARSQDTTLTGSEGPEILTASPGWPTVKVEINGLVLERPAVWIRE